MSPPEAAKKGIMTYSVKPVSCDPTTLRGLSEKLSTSDWENNYGGAVRRLDAITAELAEHEFTKAPLFVVNGLKREELIATNRSSTSCTSTALAVSTYPAMSWTRC
jgi:hypothetical protein